MSHPFEANVVKKGTDRQFLVYLHGLLELLQEDVTNDTMFRLRNIIMNTDKEQRNKLSYKDSSYDDMLTMLENQKEE